MNRSLLAVWLLLAQLLSTSVFADESEQVQDWTANVLQQTLTVNYQETAKDFYPIRHSYTYNAWGMIENFLGDLMQQVRERKLVSTPKALNEAKVTDAGVFSGIRYWRVEQAYALPQIGLQIHFSVVVIAGGVNSGTPYVIQSLSMSRKPL